MRILNEEEGEDDIDPQLIAEQMEIEEKIQAQELLRITAAIELESTNKECNICMDGFQNDQLTILTNCRHRFHAICLKGYAIPEIDNGKVPIKCPEDCKENLSELDLAVVLDENYTLKYQKFGLKNYIDNLSEEASWCPTPNCSYGFITEKDITEFNCPLCQKHYCLSCRVEFHAGQSCREYRINNTYSDADKKFEQFIKGSKFKQCAKCKFWVEKASGCNYMKCRCSHEFCYSCGQGRGNCKCGGFSGH